MAAVTGPSHVANVSDTADPATKATPAAPSPSPPPAMLHFRTPNTWVPLKLCKKGLKACKGCCKRGVYTEFCDLNLICCNGSVFETRVLCCKGIAPTDLRLEEGARVVHAMYFP